MTSIKRKNDGQLCNNDGEQLLSPSPGARKHVDGLACDDFYAQHYLYIRNVNKWFVPTSYEKSIVFETMEFI